VGYGSHRWGPWTVEANRGVRACDRAAGKTLERMTDRQTDTQTIGP